MTRERTARTSGGDGRAYFGVTAVPSRRPASTRRRRDDEPKRAVDPDRWADRRKRQRRRRDRAARRRRRALWALAYASAAALVATGGLGLLARVSSPASDWVPQVAALALPVVGPLTLVVAVALGALAARTRRPAVALCAALCGAVFVGWAARAPDVGDAPRQAGPDAVLRLVTLNLGASDGREGEVARYVAESDADVVVLQEAGAAGRPYRAAVARIALDGYEPFAESGTDLGRQVVLSRLPVVSHQAGHLGDRGDHSGVYSRTVLRLGRREVAVYNVHLQPFNPDAGWSWGRAFSPSVWAETPANLRSFLAAQSAEAAALAALVAAEGRPTVVAGDFNATPDQWSRSRLAPWVRETTGRWRPDATAPSGAPVANVDGVLAGPEWRVLSSEVGPDGLSDHRPVRAVLAL